MTPFRLRCLQLDLARQIESLDTVKQFLDLAAKAGYNAVLLYLEDRVRTPSYHLQEEGQAYSPGQIRELNGHAARLGLDLIPCVATLGHAERFLAHPELEHLSEVRGDMKNRFGMDAPRQLFCITEPGFYPFLETYLREVAELFPSPYFHVGLDEFFDFNLCDRCRRAMPALADEEDAFLGHIVRVRECLRQAGKRIMMWSDMFEIYTHVLPRLPKDVVVVDWQYQEDVRFYLGHLFDQGVEDRIAQNGALGLATVLASAEMELGNPESAIRYARRKGIPDFLVTSWEKSDVFLHRTLPIIFHAGRLLDGRDPDRAWQETMAALFGSDDPLLSSAVHLAAADRMPRHFAETSETNLYTRPFAGLPLAAHTRNRIVQEMLERSRDRVATALGRGIWKDLWNSTEEKRIAAELKSAFWSVFDFGFSPQARQRAEQAEKDFRSLLDGKSADWEALRRGVPGNVFEARRQDLCEGLRKRIDALGRSSFLIVRFCMPDQYVVNHYDIEIRAGGAWRTVVSRDGCKADSTDIALFERAHCFSCPDSPDALRIRVGGMGGRGVAFVRIRTADGRRYVPDRILEIAGAVENPRHILEDDGRFAWLNGQATREQYLSPQAAGRDNHILLSLRQADSAEGLDQTIGRNPETKP